tara:strand:- start:18 stop:509 length:492 start_codon:yes stop_codon:yes gene_type:complete
LKDRKSYTTKVNSKENSSLIRIGNLIKEARLSRNETLEELASNLKIGAHQLKALEDGNKDELPEEVFVKAMVRRISDKLKLDTEFIMSEFNSTKKEVKIEEIVEEVSNTSKQNKPIKNHNPLGFGIFVLISGFLGLFASSLLFNFVSESFFNQTPKQEVINKN